MKLPDEQAATLKAKAAAQGLTLEAWLQRLATRKAGVKVMPVVDPFLAQVPAKIDLLAIAQAEEIDQPAIGVLQLAAKGVQFINQFAQVVDLGLQVFLYFRHALVQVVPVPQCLHL